MADSPPQDLADALAREAQGGASEETRKIRVRHGLYAERGRPGRYLVRIRLPAGRLEPGQMEVVARLALQFGDPPRIHLTTRQGLELCGVAGARVVELLGQLGLAGLTTRHTGGNVLRGVVCCARAGVAPDELFDVTPYALAVDQAFREDPRFQQLPRKIKVSFEGCPDDHVRSEVADIGVRAAIEKGRRGFRITLGGGLGAAPRLGFPLEPFTPADQLFATLAAVFMFFDAHGNRAIRARARLKWLVEEWGADRVREAILSLRHAHPMPEPAVLQDRTEAPPAPEAAREAWSDEVLRWQSTNVRPERCPDRLTVGVRVPLGDLEPAALSALAGLARRFAGGVRLTVDQNVVLRSVAHASLPALYAALRHAGLAASGEGQLVDITRCAGRITCPLALTNSRAAADLIARELEPDLASHPDLRDRRIRVSGCANACAHHHWADIGLFGLVRRLGGEPAPHYALLLGGGTSATPFGRRVAEVPARRVGLAVRRVFTRYLEERQSGETFPQFAGRLAPEDWAPRLADLLAPDPDPEFLWRDVDASERFQIGAGGPRAALPAGGG